MIYNILIIGAGQLGSRHLQSIKKANLRMRIFVYDISLDSLRVAEERYRQIPEEKNVEEIVFLTSLGQVAKNIDFTVVATGSGGRCEIITLLLNVCHVKYMVIEKVLFQNIQDYNSIRDLLHIKNVKAWVNCPRRMNSFYMELAKSLNGQSLWATVVGGPWGLGCNAIHFIDLIAFLCGCSDYSIKENLDTEILKSKREGYLEFTGELCLNYTKGTQCKLVSWKEGGDSPLMLTIWSEHTRVLIDENGGKAFISRRGQDWKWSEEKFRMKYQSELTAEVLEDLILNQKCDLTTYAESEKLHVPFIKMLLAFLGKNYQTGIENCPIT